MFASYCARCAGRVLVFPSQITGIEDEDNGFTVRFACTCGSEGHWHSRTRPGRVA
jgi:hypothetical protein